ncbi:hypothetical protein D9M69_593300 [compost metagenome]
MRVRREEAVRLRCLLHPGVELVERRRHFLFQDRLQGLQARLGRIIKRHEIKTTGNVFLAGSDVFRFHARLPCMLLLDHGSGTGDRANEVSSTILAAIMAAICTSANSRQVQSLSISTRISPW